MSFKDFFKRQILIARVYGIPVRIDYRWIFVFALSVALIATTVRNQWMQLGVILLPPTGNLVGWILGIVTTIALFVSVFGHELSHALMARIEGIETDEIVLHPFGGLARLRTLPASPRAEFRIAVAGPAASFLFSMLGFGLLWLSTRVEFYFAIYFFFFLAAGNLLLAVFNLFPGYPLDGGRVLRAIVWKRTGNMHYATRIAGFCGQLIALVLIAYGIYMAVAPTFRAYFMGIWAVMVGLFLLGAATGVVKSARAETTVREAMMPPIAVEPDITVQRFVNEMLPLHQQVTFPVAFNRKLLGILLLEDLKKLPREQWHTRRAREVMRSVDASMFVPANATMASARELMQSNGVGAVAVIDERYDLIGFVRQKRAKSPQSS